MTDRKYLVTVSSPSDYGDPVNTCDTVSSALHAKLPSGLTLRSVTRYDPNANTPLGKIPAIKRVRELLGAGLKDSKFLIDTAEKLGVSEWSGVVVTYHGGNNFCVADYR